MMEDDKEEIIDMISVDDVAGDVIPESTEEPKSNEASEEYKAPESNEALEENEAPESNEALEENEAPESNEALEENEAPESNEALEENKVPESIDYEAVEGRIEAILFSLGEAVDREQLAQALEIDVETVVRIIHNMMDKYDSVDRGIRIIELENSFQMCTKADYYDTLVKILNVPKKHVLTDVLLETLSIIAYKQPITRQEIEAIRGVSCAHTVNKLIEYNLVQEVGRLEAVGRPILFGTTDEFLRCFGVQSTDELPIITPDKIEDFKQQAIEEAQLTFAPVKD